MMGKQTEEVEVLIIGFGVSVIPLLRELKRTGTEYTLISSSNTLQIWQQLKDAGKLDFEMVSSVHSSFFTPDLVEMDAVQDYYATSQEFYDYGIKISQPFRDKVILDHVQLIENFEDYSLVRTTKGNMYKAKHVVCACGLYRPQNEKIKEINIKSLKNKTLVFHTTGDTANMMLARAIPQGNKAILLNNGFTALEKLVAFDAPGPKDTNWYIPILGIRTGKHYAFDPAQTVPHTIGSLWPKFYSAFYCVAWGPHPDSWLAKWVMPHLFHVLFPHTFRHALSHVNQGLRSGISNGIQTIKFYAIDVYYNQFGQDLEKHIRNNVLMNDITFWHTQGLVETWCKDRTTIDRQNKTIQCVMNGKTKTLSYDVLIEGGRETPQLPQIVSHNEQDGTQHEFEYNTRDNYLGVYPVRLNNMYFVGYTRPTTGGLANLTEMQGLMIHKLLTDPSFKERTDSTLQDLVARHNAEYCINSPHKSDISDHLVHYGNYVHQVARFLGIDREILGSAWTLNPWRFVLNLRFELLSSNNAFKMRMKGEYKVDGAEEFARKIAKHTDHCIGMLQIQLSTLWDVLLGHQCLAMMFFQYGISSPNGARDFVAFGVLYGLLVAVLENSYRHLTYLTYCFPLSQLGWKSTFQPVGMAYILYAGKDWFWCIGLCLVNVLVAFLFRQFHDPPLSTRLIFSDCKWKHKFLDFWEEYQQVYAKVMAETEEEKKKL